MVKGPRGAGLMLCADVLRFLDSLREGEPLLGQPKPERSIPLGHSSRGKIETIARFLTELVGLKNFFDVFVPQAVLAFAFLEVLACVDEEHVVQLLAFLEDQNAHWMPVE